MEGDGRYSVCDVNRSTADLRTSPVRQPADLASMGPVPYWPVWDRYHVVRGGRVCCWAVMRTALKAIIGHFSTSSGTM